MPRNTCRPSECAASQDEPEPNANSNNNNNNNNNNTGNNNEGIIKQELEAAPPVCHRKSERRRVARDIFLVFEEQTTRRRGKGAKGKSTRAKQKFGHLKVANTPRINKNVLREIKTEPKCSPEAVVPAAAAIPSIAPIPALNHPVTAQPSPLYPLPLPEEQQDQHEQQQPAKSLPRAASVKLETKTTVTSTATASNVAATKRISPKPKALPVLEEKVVPTTTPAAAALPIPQPVAPAPASSPTTPSVNPIFLWVKQDDTRIVEVRCEDYDKRNRIRLTKTTNGWRSMPRTDASSTRIVKFFHGSAAPLMKVKREQHLQRLEEEEVEQQHQQHSEHQQLDHHAEDHEDREEPHREQQLPSIGQNLLQDWEDSATQLPDDIEEEEEEEPEQAQEHETEPAAQQNGHLTTVLEDVVVLPPVQEPETTEEATPCFDGLLDSEETNASTKATKTNTPTYQSSTPSPLQMQLCPKTGLFLAKGDFPLVQLPDEDVLPEEEEEEEELDDKPLAAGDHVECFDANTKNLKDLLDDADDLLQNCSSDNGSNGADLLDSLVKRSCEDNLVQESSTGSGNNQQNTTTTSTGDELSSFCVPDLDKDLPRILSMDSDDAPKCLSFNEAGEIEGLNGELFLGIEAFEKQQEAVATEPEPQPPTPATVELTQTPTPTPTPEKEKEKPSGGDETPKDLSYKKREEVCPPSESRSQCAVTSSSDILKSPERDLQLPANSIPAEVETTSETIKNLILEQFLKLNNNPQQAEPMDLGKAGRDGKLETVVIDDEEEEESSQPLKKRPKASIKMDKDPDALTQLKMLISNPQWKVPDPILVPKDRLGAVLASPAREIPLLLTTRPELRLPEAFAYPEIIQNPNILVVTMEQLEAILKTESEQAAKAAKDPDPVIVVPSKPRSPSPKQTLPKPVQAQPKPPVVPPVAPTPPSPADSSLSTDLNATTLALLQQMLWLPYFGQLSQEFFKTIKDPLGLQRKFMSNLLPLYNSQFGLQHLDELYKHCIKQKPTEEQQSQQQQQQPKVPTPVPPAAAAPPPAAPAPVPQSPAGGSNAFNGFTNPVELALMQKLLQPQLPQFLNWDAAKEASSSSSSTAAPSHHHHQEHKRPRREPQETEAIANFTKTKTAAGASNTTAAPSTAAPVAPVATTAAPATPAPAEHKPRLTIKSLSNLLEPEANVVPLLNVPFDGMRGRPNALSMHKSASDHQVKGGDTGTGHGRTLRSSKACVTYNPLEQAKQQMHPAAGSQQQRKRGNMLAQDVQQQQQQQHLAETAAAGMDANSALWHPLFGSNPKQGYNSPWQWTTVTASGE
ncbi:uncharacterized protein LOC108087496 [Drosophila ficusphila]|uniref:uncharacterized protein LOC108087496 n=1 Tax=Drosophila ficusphila TaxID=30025 RepID=UPI0007E63589|nr:uncharacterized protein LOC108087496 [Drosophila ficusphila]